jgi:hypothetical protein
VQSWSRAVVQHEITKRLDTARATIDCASRQFGSPEQLQEAFSMPPRYRNVTIRIDEQVLLWARMRSLFLGRSVNRLIVDYLEDLADIPPDGMPREDRPPFLWEDNQRIAAENLESDRRKAQRLAQREALNRAHERRVQPAEPSGAEEGA